MIAFGSAITDHELYRRCAEPGIRLVAEPDSEVMAFGSAGLATSNRYAAAQGFRSFGNNNNGIRFAFPVLPAKVCCDLLHFIRDLRNKNRICSSS